MFETFETIMKRGKRIRALLPPPLTNVGLGFQMWRHSDVRQVTWCLSFGHFSTKVLQNLNKASSGLRISRHCVRMN